MEKILHGLKLPMPHFEKSVGELFFDALQNPKSPNKDILIDGITNVSFTTEECFRKTILVANKLHKLGVGKGDMIAIISPNSVDYAFAAIACLYLGAPIHPINPEYKSLEIKHAFTISKPKFVIVNPEKLREIQESTKDMKFVETLVSFEDLKEQINYSDKEISEVESNLPLAKGSQMNDAIAIILSSAGTTGLPKGVSITQLSFKNTIFALGSADCGFELQGNSAIHAVLPFYHMFGFVTLMACFVLNARAIVLPKFKPDVYLQTIETYRITTLFLVPPIALFFANSPLTEKYDLSSITTAITGGSPLDSETKSSFEAKLGWKLRQLYGMTEAAAISITPLHDTRFPGSVGKLIPNTQVKIADIDTQKTLGTNQVGEICIKGPTLLKDYFGNSDATKAIFDSDGFVHTGDIGCFNDEEFLFIQGRLKELIKYKGFQIAPAELEDILMKHAGIVDAAVIGIKDERAGEIPKAYVVRKPNYDLSEEDVKNFLAHHVTSHKQLHGGVEFIDKIPRSAVGKILRRQLHDLVGQQRQ